MRVKLLEQYGLYVSSNGRVVFDAQTAYVYTFFKARNGYLLVQKRFKRGARKSFLAHRLVAEAFVKNPHNFPEVNHLDGDKYNNDCSNLEWTTRKKNMAHAVSLRLFRYKISKEHESVVLEMLAAGFSQTGIACLFHTSQSTISKIKLRDENEQKARNGVPRADHEAMEKVDAGGVV